MTIKLMRRFRDSLAACAFFIGWMSHAYLCLGVASHSYGADVFPRKAYLVQAVVASETRSENRVSTQLVIDAVYVGPEAMRGSKFAYSRDERKTTSFGNLNPPLLPGQRGIWVVKEANGRLVPIITGLYGTSLPVRSGIDDRFGDVEKLASAMHECSQLAKDGDRAAYLEAAALNDCAVVATWAVACLADRNDAATDDFLARLPVISKMTPLAEIHYDQSRLRRRPLEWKHSKLRSDVFQRWCAGVWTTAEDAQIASYLANLADSPDAYGVTEDQVIMWVKTTLGNKMETPNQKAVRVAILGGVLRRPAARNECLDWLLTVLEDNPESLVRSSVANTIAITYDLNKAERARCMAILKKEAHPDVRIAIESMFDPSKDSYVELARQFKKASEIIPQDD